MSALAAADLDELHDTLLAARARIEHLEATHQRLRHALHYIHGLASAAEWRDFPTIAATAAQALGPTAKANP